MNSPAQSNPRTLPTPSPRRMARFHSREVVAGREYSWALHRITDVNGELGEIVSHDPKDGYLDMATRGVKLSSMHKDQEKYRFSPGQPIRIRCDAEAKPVLCRVLGVDIGPLEKADPLLLLVNGFFSAEEAHSRLKQFYAKQGPFTPQTRMVNITFVADPLFDGLSEDARQLLIATPPSYSFRQPELRPLVLPSLAQWVAWRYASVDGWLRWLSEQRLILRKEMYKALKFAKAEAPAQERFKLQSVLDKPKSDLYRRIVTLDLS